MSLQPFDRLQTLAACTALVFGWFSASAAAQTPTQTGPAWTGLADLPFIPIPEVGTDPNSGTTLGFLPVFLTTDEQHEVRQVIAPDIIRSPDFGYGARGRIFAYPSEDTQWYAVAGAKQRVERELDALYTTGLQRQDQWSGFARIVYDRSGTARFFGLGNETSLDAQSNYTNEQAYAELSIGRNLSHAWQIAYIARPRYIDAEPGTLEGIPSTSRKFTGQAGIGANHEFYHRVQISYDTRDALTVPRQGMQFVALFGASDRSLLSSTSYTVASLDFRSYTPVDSATTLALHTAFRYMPTGDNIPFWALSSLGGDRSVIGEQQPLRGFGEDRFIDRNMFSASAELRRSVLDLQLFATDLSLELAPFIDTGRVFSGLGDNPFADLHVTGGLGFRAVASPFLVGYVDVGYGSEGTAVFSGISYPF